MYNIPSNIDSLIAKWLSGELNEDEKIKFTEWLGRNPDAINDINEIKLIWDNSDVFEVPAGESITHRWSKLNKSIAPKLLNLHFFYKAASIAAAFIILMTFILFVKSKHVQIVTQNADIKNIILPDKSSVIVNSGSVLQYNSFFWFSKRTVSLKGEALFNVKKENIAFIVKSGKNKIEVVGTSFNVKDRNQELTVACLNGKVKIIPQSRNNYEIILEKGEMGIISNNEILQKTFDENKKLVASWINGTLYFDNTPLPEVFREIERFYDIKIYYNGRVDVNFSGNFATGNIDVVLQTICSTANLQYSKKDSSVINIK